MEIEGQDESVESDGSKNTATAIAVLSKGEITSMEIQ